jgi:DNA (cytosine-5)-methyltransferase 1
VRYLSVCSGIEAATVAWHPLGWTPAAFSEIDKFPRAVLRHHYPDVPLHGDFTTIEGHEYGPVDLLVGGTPCQSFSVAGLRKGMDDPRGNLALGYLGLAARLNARWLVWENVPGVLSSNGGRDFGAFLGGLAELGYGFAYRVLDAQFFGVPQRRRRVFVVGYLGDWRRAAAVLFERHSLQGHPAPSREAGQAAPTLPSRSSAGGGLRTDFDCDGGLIHAQGIAHAVTCHAAKGGDPTTDNYVAHTLRADGFDASEDGTVRGTPLVPISFAHQQGGSADLHTGEDVSIALQRSQTPAIAFSCKDSGGDAGDLSPTLRAMGHDGSHANAGGQVAVAFDWQKGDGGSDESFRGKSRSWITRAGDYTGALGATKRDAVAYGPAVRRITPVEAERLQGFPDGYTAIPWRGKPADQCPDGPRYRALGNSFAVPVVRWIGERIAAVEALTTDLEAAA